MQFKFLVYRQEKITPTNFMMLSAITDKTVTTQKQFIAAIRKAVKGWVQSTVEGRATYRYSGTDMNIGDLAEYAEEIVQYSNGVITSLKFEEIESAEEMTFDTSLCDEVEIND